MNDMNDNVMTKFISSSITEFEVTEFTEFNKEATFFYSIRIFLYLFHLEFL